MKKSDDFVNFHMHSFFSALDGMPSPEDIIKRIMSLGQKSFAITDHGNLSCIPQAYQAAQKYGVGFTPGIEAYYTHKRKDKYKDRYQKDYYHMILLAYSDEGYQNLVKMQTTSWIDGVKGKYPRLDHEVLNEYNKGLTVTTSCLGGLIPQHILRGKLKEAEEELGTLVDIFGKENVYIELQNHHQQEDKIVLPELLRLHQRSGVKLLATSDSHYCLPEDYEAHDSLLAIQTNKKKEDANRFKFVNDEFYIPSRARMEELLPPSDFPNAISNTVELAEKTDFNLKINDKKEYLMPHIETLPGMTEEETLRERVILGAKDPKRYGGVDGTISKEVQDRIDYELSVIESMGFGGYFIIVADMIEDFAKHGINAGPGRGCLHGETLVVTPEGNKRIDEITTDDKVMSGDGKWRSISKVIRHETAQHESLLKIALDHGQVIKLTPKHKVLIHSDDHADPVWRKARDIKAGDRFAYVQGDVIEYNTVTYVDIVDAPEYVYDITVKDGDPSFLTVAGTVHNSAPGSVIVYCMGITDVDPFEHNLFFERFLNPDRISMPDIDVDIPQSKRQEALAIMEQKYGIGHVAHLSSYSTMGTKQALNSISKVHSIPVKFTAAVNEYCDSKGINIQQLAEMGLPEEVANKKEFLSYDYDTMNTVLSEAAKLEGTLSTYGVHASGIVVTNTPIDDNFPIRTSKKVQLPITQYDGVDVEKLGGVKIDILGLINIDHCEDAERNIRLDLGEEVDSTNVPFDDPEVYKMLSRGEGGGVFQLGCLAGDTIVDGMTIKELYLRRNSDGRKKSLRSMFFGEGVIKPNHIDDVVYSGKKQLYKLVTSSGEIRATGDHKFFTPSGWKPLSEIARGDHVIRVDKKIGYRENIALNVRGVQDMYDMFEQIHDAEIVRVDGEIVDTTYNTFKADFREKYPNYNDYWKVVPDNGLFGSTEIMNNVNDDPSNITLKIITYSEIVEKYYSIREHGLNDILLPEGTYWETVEEIVEDKVEDTYDIMMRDPVNNFIANDIVVHNSSGMQSLMRVLKPQEFKDLSALIALYRPGPMGMDTHNEYARRKNLGAAQNVLHDDMKEILARNYNLIVYQEDIMALAKSMAGYTGGEADTLRKATAKKDPKMMKEQEEKFIPAINERYYKGLGEDLWAIIKPFGEYAFNQSHSVAYGFTTYRTAWLKTHYPAQFGAAVIDNVIDKPDRLLPEFVWMKQMGLSIKHPCINKSGLRSITDSNNAIQLPIHLVKGLGIDVSREIVSEREKNGEYKSVVDFVARTKTNMRTLEAMTKAGCFDNLGTSRAAIIHNRDLIMAESKKQSSREAMRHGLFSNFYDNSTHEDSQWTSPEAAPDYYIVNNKIMNIDINLYALWEKEAMGVLIGPHPFDILREYKLGMKLMGAYPPITEFKRPNNDIKAIGYITDIVVKYYERKGERKALTSFNIETNEGIVPGVIFDKLAEDSGIEENTFVYIEGRLVNDNKESDDLDDFSPNVMPNKIKPLDMEKIYAGGKI